MKSSKLQNPKKGKPDSKSLARSSDKSAKVGEVNSSADADKERLIKRVGVIPVKSQHVGDIEVRVVARGKKLPRVSITRTSVKAGGVKQRSLRLGRISRAQAGKLIELLKEAVSLMKSAPAQASS